MRILITGGLGYIGGRLACYFKEHCPDYELFLTTTRDHYPEWCSGLNIIKLNIADKDQVNTCVASVKPDAIVHLAGLSQRQCADNPDLAEQVNVQGTRHLMSAALAAGVAKVIYFSTFQVYGSGDSLTGDITESTPLQPTIDYGQSKLIAEQIVLENDYDKINRIILRLSNAFGAPQDMQVADDVWKLVFNAFALNAVQGDAIHPRANACRDYITMTDVLRAVEHCLKLPSEKNGVYNLGGENMMTVNQVADAVVKCAHTVMDKKVSVTHAETASQNVFTYNIEKIKNTGFVLDNKIEEEVRGVLIQVKQKIC